MNLDFENIDQLFEDSLEGLELKPSAQVKTQVQKKMFWHNAFTNTYFRVALALVLLLTVAGSYMLLNNPQESQNTEMVAVSTEPIQVNTPVDADLEKKINIIEENQALDSQEEVNILVEDNSETQANTKPVVETKVVSDFENNNPRNNTTNNNTLNTTDAEESKSQNQDDVAFAENNKTVAEIPESKTTAAKITSTKLVQGKTINQSESVIVSDEAKPSNKQALPTADYQQNKIFRNSSITLLEARINFALW